MTNYRQHLTGSEVAKLLAAIRAAERDLAGGLPAALAPLFPNFKF